MDFANWLGIALVVWAGGEGVARIIRSAKAHSRKSTAQVEGLRSQLEDLSARIEVLERIATDGREQLRREIDGL